MVVKFELNRMGQEKSNELIFKIDEFLIGFYRVLPFTYLGMSRQILSINKKGKTTMLDLACGDGTNTSRLNLPSNYEVVGVDIYPPYIKLARDKKVYKKVIKKDVRQYPTSQKFDIVFASHVLEHMPKDEGYKFLDRIKKNTKKRLVVAAPIGKHPQGEYDKNPYQKHKASWTVNDLKDLGFKVRVQGVRRLWGTRNIVSEMGLFSYILFGISFIATPLLQFFPEQGTYMIAFKDLD